ncbi:hypothetical protein V8E53_013269 [Lactarius tabidus]
MPSEGLRADRPSALNGANLLGTIYTGAAPTCNRAYSGERPYLRELGGGLAGMQRRDASSRDKDCDSWELHHRGSMKRDTPQGIPAQRPSPQLGVQRTDSPKYLPYLAGTPNDHASYNPSDENYDQPGCSPLECAFYGTTTLDAPFGGPAHRPVANKPVC